MESVKHLTLAIQAVLWRSLDDHFAIVFIAAKTSGKIVKFPNQAWGGSRSCPYISLLLKLVQNLVAASSAIQLLTDR